MSPELAALLKASKASPDDGPRLVLADWLDDHGEADRAEVIRLQLALENGWPEEPDTPAREVRIKQLLKRNAERWTGPLARHYYWSDVRLGLLRISASPRQLLDHPPAELGEDVFAWVEELRLAIEPDGLDELLSSPILGGFSRLILDGSPDGERDRCLGTKGVERLAASSHLEGVRALDLSFNKVTPQAVAALARCERLAGLRELNLDSNPFGDAGARALAKAPWLAGLSRLSLGDTRAGARGLAALAASPRLSGLRELALHNLQLDEAATRALAGSPHLAGVTSLDLGNTSLAEGALRALADGPFLMPASLTLEHSSGLGGGAGKVLAGARLLERVRALRLRGRPGQRGVRAVLASPRLARLEYLDLDIPTGDSGCEVLAGAGHFANLRVVNLRGKAIGPRGATALARSPHLGRLVALALEGKLGPDGVSVLGEGPGLPRVEALSLPRTLPGARGVKALVSSALGARLKRLNLNYNRLGDEGAAALAHLPDTACLVEQQLDSNEIGPAGAAALAGCAALRRLQRLVLGSNQLGERASRSSAAPPTWRTWPTRAWTLVIACLFACFLPCRLVTGLRPSVSALPPAFALPGPA